MKLNRTPLYRQVADLLRQEIATKMKVGDRLEAEEKLARRLSVSVITIREALWILAGEGRIIREHGRGTFVAEPTNRGRHVAVLIERDIAHPRLAPFFLQVTQQVRAFLESKGHQVQIYIGRLQPGESSRTLTCLSFLENAEAGNIAGVVAVYALPDPSWIVPLEKAQVPLVGIGIQHRYMIDTDYDGMVETGVRYLVERGRTKIACLGWNREADDPGGDPGGEKPYERAVERVFAKFGLTPRRAWLRNDLHPAGAGAGWEEFREIWALSDEKPDGLFVMDEHLFRDAATAILDLNIRVPQDLTVVTQANVGSQILCPFPAAGLVVDPNEVAARLAEMLHTLLLGKPLEQERHHYPFRLQAIGPSGTEAATGLRRETDSRR